MPIAQPLATHLVAHHRHQLQRGSSSVSNIDSNHNVAPDLLQQANAAANRSVLAVLLATPWGPQKLWTGMWGRRGCDPSSNSTSARGLMNVSDLSMNKCSQLSENAGHRRFNHQLPDSTAQ